MATQDQDILRILIATDNHLVRCRYHAIPVKIQQLTNAR